MARFIPNPLGMQEFARSAQMAEAMMFVSSGLTERIRQLIPVQVPGGGFARKSVRPIISRELHSLWGPVAGVRITGFSKLLHLIEFGTSQRLTKEGAARGEMPAFAPFRRAAEATGSFVPSGREVSQ